MITAEVRKAIKCESEYSVFLKIPYNPDLISKVKALPERYWNSDIKLWEIPLKYAPRLFTDSAFTGVKITDPNNELIKKETPQVKETCEIPVDYTFKTKPYEHQIEGIEYGLNHKKFLLGDEQGLGKTMQVINIACIKKKLYNYKHCLIICGVNGLKWNWRAEILKHSNEVPYILGTRLNNGKEVIGSMNDRIEDLKVLLTSPKVYQDRYFLITNVETLRNEEIQELLHNLCKMEIINMIAFDEFHKCKNPSSQQGKAILKLQADNMIAMTGTPLMNSPIDLYTPLKWLGYEDHGFYQFRNHYCTMGGFGGYQIVGYKNLEQLQNRLAECTLRRLKKDVLDLPDKIYTTEYVEMSPKQEKIYKEVKMEIKENIDKIASSPNPLSEMIRLRQATDYTGILSTSVLESAKFERLEELLEEIVENGQKALIFSNWTSVINPLYKRLKKYNPALITGEVKDREAEQNKFMNDNKCKVILGTTPAMGTGLTLTAGTYVIFVDEPWNRALREQAEDRAHRIGTTENINIIFLLCKGTIDERIHQLVEDKGAMADMLVDGKVATQDKAELIEFLLS